MTATHPETAKISQVRVHHPKRYPWYPSNGRMQTKWMVKLEGGTAWLRVYDRCVSPRDGSVAAVFVPVIKRGQHYVDLTPEETAVVGYSFHAARKD